MLLVLFLSAAACGGPGPPPMIGPAGRDMDGAPIEVVPAMYLRQSMMLREVHDGDPIDLELPPQGGHVLFVGARLRNVREQTVRLQGRLLDDKTGAEVAQDARSVTLMPAPDDPTLWVPDLRSYATVANIPVCPAKSAVDLYDRPFLLEVVVTELSSGRSGSVRRRAVPSCRQPEMQMLKLCQCECAANYAVGKCSYS